MLRVEDDTQRGTLALSRAEESKAALLPLFLSTLKEKSNSFLFSRMGASNTNPTEGCISRKREKQG